jgi:hypothetical protein
MKTKQQDIQTVEALQDGEFCTVFWLEEGGGEVRREENKLILFEIPQFGGISRLYGEFPFSSDGIKNLVDIAHTWT